MRFTMYFVAFLAIAICAGYLVGQEKRKLLDANLQTALYDLATATMQEQIMCGELPQSINMITPNASGDARSRFLDFSIRWPNVTLVDTKNQANFRNGPRLIYTPLEGAFLIAAYDDGRLVASQTFETK